MCERRARWVVAVKTSFLRNFKMVARRQKTMLPRQSMHVARWTVHGPYGIIAGGDGEDASCERVWRIGVWHTMSPTLTSGLPIRAKLTFCKGG